MKLTGRMALPSCRRLRKSRILSETGASNALRCSILAQCGRLALKLLSDTASDGQMGHLSKRLPLSMWISVCRRCRRWTPYPLGHRRIASSQPPCRPASLQVTGISGCAQKPRHTVCESPVRGDFDPRAFSAVTSIQSGRNHAVFVATTLWLWRHVPFTTWSGHPAHLSFGFVDVPWQIFEPPERRSRGQVAGQRALRAGPMIDGEHWQNHVLFDAAGVAVLRACPRDRDFVPQPTLPMGLSLKYPHCGPQSNFL